MGSKCSSLGINLGCFVVDNELEIISHILNDTKLTQVSLKEELQRFLSNFTDYSNLNYNENIVSLFDDSKIKLNQYIESILHQNSIYVEAQKKYFEAIITKYKYLKKIICIFCIIIIFQTNANYKDKVDMLFEKIKIFYGVQESSLKVFVNDLIELNTEVCKLSFMGYFDSNELVKIDNLFEPYRIEKLFNRILASYYDKNIQGKIHR